jgi:WD40 repeat protein
MRYSLLAAFAIIGAIPAGAQQLRDFQYTELCDGRRPPEIARLAPAARAEFEKQIAGLGEQIEIACTQARLSPTPIHDTADADPAATHKHWVFDAAFTPDGRQIVSASYDRTLRLWDVATGRHLRVIAEFPGRALRLALSPDGRQAAVAVEDDGVRLIEIESGKSTSLRSTMKDGWLVATDGTGRVIAPIDDKTVGIFSANGQGPVLRLDGHARKVYWIAVSDVARLIATADDGGMIYLWDLATGKQTETIKVGRTAPAALTFSPDGSKLAFAVDDKVFIRDIAGRRSSPLVDSHWKLGMNRLVFTRNGKGLLAARVHPVLWNAETGERLRLFGPFNDHVHGLSVSPDGKHMVTSHIGSDLRMWEIDTGVFFRRFGRDVNPPR